MLSCCSSRAQHLDFGFGVGVKGGPPFLDLVELVGNATGRLTARDNYVVGPVVELRLPFGFAIEADGLYRGTKYRVVDNANVTTEIDCTSWEIPYLAKFRFPIPLLKPFVSAGGAYRVFSSLPPEVGSSHNGIVGGAGLELRIKRLRLSTEARYIRWHVSGDQSGVRLSRSQGEVLFGIIF
jgi:hypothetical protein